MAKGINPICGVLKRNDTNEFTCKTEKRLTDLENEFMVTRRERMRGKDS